MDDGLKPGADGKPRCWWCNSAPEYIDYHDTEWGFPVSDDQRLFEKICLEGFQSGLSWLTILRKRPGFRRAFKKFDFTKIAHLSDKRVDELLTDSSIVRHRKKIASVFNNARCACATVEEFGSLAAYFWRFEPAASSRPSEITKETLRQLSKTPESKALAKDLKSRGWTWVGPTTVYAFMQAMGLVNDHLEGCVTRELVESARRKFKKPN